MASNVHPSVVNVLSFRSVVLSVENCVSMAQFHHPETPLLKTIPIHIFTYSLSHAILSVIIPFMSYWQEACWNWVCPIVGSLFILATLPSVGYNPKYFHTLLLRYFGLATVSSVHFHNFLQTVAHTGCGQVITACILTPFKIQILNKKWVKGNPIL